MGYKVLYRKYRPDNFDNVVGQVSTVEMLKNAIKSGKNAHAYIFTGPRGTGKTSSARIFAKALNCESPVNGSPCNECNSCNSYANFKENPDIIEIDAASNNGVDEIRELINNVKFLPTLSKYKVYIIDEVHMLTDSAFNALLLTLEEPPAHVIFILATTDIQDVPVTILSRCQRFDFKPINKKALIDRLNYVCDQEKIKITSEAIEEIATMSSGGLRDALGMLDQLRNDDSEITLDIVSSYFGSISVKIIEDLFNYIDSGDTSGVIEIMKNISESGTNYSVFVGKLIDVLLDKAKDIKLGNINCNLSFESIFKFVFDLNECLTKVNMDVDPYSLIEIVLLKYVCLGNNEKVNYFPGNNVISSTVEEKIMGNNKGNTVENNQQSDDLILEKSAVSSETKDKKVKKKAEKKTVNIDVLVRINNAFVKANKEYKKEFNGSWVDFMNYMMKKSRSLVSLLADCVILAVSDEYVLLQSKIDSTNDLINIDVKKIEKYYEEYSGKSYKFASVNETIWNEELKKYMNNHENKIQYTYMEENIVGDSVDSIEDDSDDIEDVAKDIFGSYDVE